MMNKKAILFSDNEELFKAFERSFRTVGCIEVCRFKEVLLKDKNRVICLTKNEDNLQELFYEKIRTKYLNPVIVIGFSEKEVFVKEHPLFSDHPFNHGYLRIPFELKELIILLNDMIPISSHAIRRAVCGSDAGYKGYILTLLSHDLLKDRVRCIEILEMASSFINGKELLAETKNKINKLKGNGLNWPSVASELGQKLMNIIKGN